MKRASAFANCRPGTDDPDSREARLLRRVQAHDRIAFREVVEQLKTKVFSVSYALLGDASEADVAAQKVFVRLYWTAGRVAQQHDLTQYVYRLAIDRCLVELRMRRLRRLFGLVTRPTAISNGTVDGNRERIPAVRALSMLPDKERALLVLKEVADQSVEEIADIMLLDPAVVRRRLFSARQKFRAGVAAE